MAAAESEIAAKLIERLLSDPAFRDRFRRDPPRACREAGLESLAEEMRLGAGKAMHTLDIRESRSSLAGVMMAAAMEGMGVYEFSQHVVPHLEDLTGELGDVLSRVNLPALPGAGSLSGGSKASAAAMVGAPPGGDEAAVADAGGNGAAPSPAAPAPAADATAPPAAEPPAPDEGGKAPASPEEAAVEPDGGKAAKVAAREESPPAAPELAGLADREPAEDATRAPVDEPAGSELPSGDVQPQASQGGPEPGAGGGPPAADAAPAPQPQASSEPVDPSQLGQEGTGGKPNAEALALLENKNVVLDDVGVADIKAGRIDPRIVGVVTKLSQEHRIVVSCMCSDHSKFTAGGSVSNHAFGRGLDIASIDGEIVSPGSALAREVASQLSELDPAIRPDEIGSPFAISAPGYFTDAAHSNHIHVGFKQQITPDFKLPAELSAGTQQPAAPAAAAVPAAAVAAPVAAPVAPELAAAAGIAPPPDPKRASGLFAAAEPAKVAAIGAEPKPAEGDSKLFLQAVAAEQQQQQQPAAVAAAPPVVDPAAAAVDLSGVAGAYPGDNAPKEQIAAWMAKQAEQRGLPPQLPVMAALVESNLTNVNYGDADSLGYFQMRVSIWNQGEYAGYPDDPKKQIDWFLDTAERVKEQRLARGQSITDPDQFGEWIADVERPAEQYRGRYQLKLGEADNLLKNAPPAAPEAAATAPPAESAVDAAAPAAPPSGAGPKALAALEEAKKFLGTPYKWGGSTPQTGFDCSGLVQWAYAQAGVQIPRVTHEQIEAVDATPVRRSELLPGDLVFFRDPSGYVYHVGISMGGDKFLHAPRTGDVVKFASLAEPYYSERFTGGRRFDAGAAAAAPAAVPAAPAAAPAVDPVAVAAAQAAVARDAAEARQQNSGLFNAINAQEARNHKETAGGDRALASAAASGILGDRSSELAGERAAQDSGLFFKAITAEQAAKAKAAAEAAKAAPAAPEAAAPAVPEAAAPAPAAPEAAAGAAPPELAASAPAAPEAAPIPEGPPPDLADVPADYPGDGAGQEELAKWLAKRAEKAGLPPELPVMAALVESGVRNLDYGDADSVGFFQMRVGIWNKGEYAGYPENPGLQAKWFIDTALAVKRQRIAAGDAGFGKDPRKWGEWIADIERPAEQYRGRYQLRLAEARRLLR